MNDSEYNGNVPPDHQPAAVFPVNGGDLMGLALFGLYH